MPSGIPKGQKAKRSKTKQSQEYTLATRRYLAHLVRVRGYSYADAFRTVFPHRAAKMKGPRSPSYAGKQIFEAYMEEHHKDLEEMGELFNINTARYYEELDQRLQATTLKEIVKTKLIQETRHDKRGRPYKKKVPVVVRNTEDVIDNTTRMNATSELGKAIGVHKQDFAQANIIIYKPGPVQKPHGAGRSKNVPPEEQSAGS